MGVNASKEVIVLEAIARNDARKLKESFANSFPTSPAILCSVLTEGDLDAMRKARGGCSDESRIHLMPKAMPNPKWVGLSPLHIVSEQRDTRMLSYILYVLSEASAGNVRHGEKLFEVPEPEHLWGVRDVHGLSPLSRAIQAGNAQAASLLLDAGADIDEVHDSSADGLAIPRNWSHIRYCASTGATSLLKLLLQRGADKDSWERDGRRPIHLAVAAGNLGCVKDLLGADEDGQLFGNRRLTQPAQVHQPKLRFPRRRSLKGNFFRNTPSAQKLVESNFAKRRTPAASSSYSRAFERGRRAVDKYIVRESTVAQQGDENDGLSSATVSVASRTVTADGAPEDTESQGQGPVRLLLQNALQEAFRSLAPTPEARASTYQSNRNRGASLLHIACANSHPHVLSHLLSLEEFIDGIEDTNDSGKSPIFMAIRHGSLDCLKVLMKAGAKVEAKDIENWTVLHEAVKAGDDKTDILRYLIDKCGADATVVDDDGWTPLHVAARFSSAEAVDILVKAGCDVNAKTEDNETPLLLASAQPMSANVLGRLLACGADLSVHRNTALSPSRLIVGRKDFDQLCIILDHLETLDEDTRRDAMDMDSRSENGDTLLHLCVTMKNVEATTKLLSLGVKTDEKNDDGLAPLHAACKDGSADIASALLGAGCDISLPMTDGMVPLHIACDNGHAAVVQILLRHGCDVNQSLVSSERYSGFSPLMFASRLGNSEIITILIEAEANLDQAKGDGFTALHLGALNGNTEACGKLVQAGANYRLADETGYHPLQLATRHNQYDVVNILLASGVEANSCSALGSTALHVAAFICDARLIWLLLRYGADVHLTNKDAATPLHVAAGRDNGRVSMQLLVSNGAELSVVDGEKDTPMHKACYKGLYQNVRMLLRRGAEPSPRNESNVTPLHLAAAAGSEETVETLLRYDADVNARDEDGKTPYRVAAEQRHRRAMVLLFRGMNIRLDEIAPLRRYGSEAEEQADEVICVICQNALVEGEASRLLGCFHTYHDDCILEWLGGEDLTRHDSCPLCVKSVLPAPESDPDPDPQGAH